MQERLKEFGFSLLWATGEEAAHVFEDGAIGFLEQIRIVQLRFPEGKKAGDYLTLMGAGLNHLNSIRQFFRLLPAGRRQTLIDFVIR